MDAPILNWILFLGREVTTQVRRRTVLAGRIRSADQNRFAAPPFLGPTSFSWRMFDMERLGVQVRLGAREGVCSSCYRPIRPNLCRFTTCAHLTYQSNGRYRTWKVDSQTGQLFAHMLPLLMMRHRRISRRRWHDHQTPTGKHWIEQVRTL